MSNQQGNSGAANHLATTVAQIVPWHGRNQTYYYNLPALQSYISSCHLWDFTVIWSDALTFITANLYCSVAITRNNLISCNCKCEFSRHYKKETIGGAYNIDYSEYCLKHLHSSDICQMFFTHCAIWMYRNFIRLSVRFAIDEWRGSIAYRCVQCTRLVSTKTAGMMSYHYIFGDANIQKWLLTLNNPFVELTEL